MSKPRFQITISCRVAAGGKAECRAENNGRQEARADWGPAYTEYEVHAPEGMHFSEGAHSLVCFGMKDARDRTAHDELVECPEDCDCRYDPLAAHVYGDGSSGPYPTERGSRERRR